MSEIAYAADERLSYAEYLDFLERSELRRLYPKRDFRERFTRALAQAGVTVTARERGRLVGTCMGLTDSAYFLFVTDLTVAKSHAGRGLDDELLRLAVEAAGGAEDITVIAWSDPQSMSAHAARGLLPQDGLIARDPVIDAWFDPTAES